MTDTHSMSQAKSQRDANRILMATFGWPEEIQENPIIAEPPKEEPRQEQGEDGLMAIYEEPIREAWITGYPL